MPSISVILLTYNREQYLPDMLDSLRNQTFDDYELILSEVIQSEQYDNPQSSINMCMTTVELLMEQAQETGINNEFPLFAQGLFKKALDAGYGHEELSALIKI